jgi:hypothetical protein
VIAYSYYLNNGHPRNEGSPKNTAMLMHNISRIRAWFCGSRSDVGNILMGRHPAVQHIMRSNALPSFGHPQKWQVFRFFSYWDPSYILQGVNWVMFDITAAGRMHNKPAWDLFILCFAKLWLFQWHQVLTCFFWTSKLAVH